MTRTDEMRKTEQKMMMQRCYSGLLVLLRPAVQQIERRPWHLQIDTYIYADKHTSPHDNHSPNLRDQIERKKIMESIRKRMDDLDGGTLFLFSKENACRRQGK